MVRSSAMVTMDIALVKAANSDNQNKINSCSAKLGQLQDRIDELDKQKDVLGLTHSVYTDLKKYIVDHLASLEDTSVCITEIESEATEQIGGKIDSALKAIESLVSQIKSNLITTNSDYNTTYEQLQTYKTNLANGQQRLGTLKTELEQAKAAEMPVM